MGWVCGRDAAYGFAGCGVQVAGCRLRRVGLAAVFEVAFDGLLAILLGGFLFLAEGFLDGAVAFLIIEFAEIVGFAFTQAGTLPGGGILAHVCRVCCFTTVVSRKGTINWVESGRFSAESAASLPGSTGSAAAVGPHLLEFAVLVGCQDCFEAVVTGGHECFELFAFLLREEVVVVMDGLGLAAEVILAGFQFGYLVIGEIEGLAEPVEAGAGHELGPVFTEPMRGGLLIFLERGEEGLCFGLLFLFEGDEAGLVLFQGDIILFEQVFAFLPVVFVDRHYLFPLVGGVVDKFAVTVAEAVVVVRETILVLAEAVVVLVLTEAVLAAVMHGMGGVRCRVVACGLGVGGPTEE